MKLKIRNETTKQIVAMKLSLTMELNSAEEVREMKTIITNGINKAEYDLNQVYAGHRSDIYATLRFWRMFEEQFSKIYDNPDVINILKLDKQQNED